MFNACGLFPIFLCFRAVDAAEQTVDRLISPKQVGTHALSFLRQRKKAVTGDPKETDLAEALCRAGGGGGRDTQAACQMIDMNRLGG